MTEVELHVETDVIVADARRLRAVWRYEAEQDLRRSFNNFLPDLGTNICIWDFGDGDSKEKINWMKEGF